MTQNHKNNHLVTYFIGAILGLGLGINGILRDQSAELTTFTIVTCIAGAACLVRSAYLYGRLTESQGRLPTGVIDGQATNQSNVL
jgi:TM2 domain-containing membrane protein YozV